MLIYIDNTIAEYLDHNQLDSNQQAFFASLALAHQKGQCIVFGQVKSIKALITCLGSPINGIYKSILSKYSEYGSIAKWTSSVFVISCQEEAGLPSTLPDVLLDKARYCSVEDAALMNWTLGSCLLGENISDCVFYEFIGKYYAKKNKIRNVRIVFHHEQGGGSDIGSVLRKCVKTDALPTLCITDTDMKYGAFDKNEKAAKGGTFSACDIVSKQLVREGYMHRFCFTHNSVHEIENLVPLSLLKMLGNEICLPEGIKHLEELEKIEHGEPILYYDFKKGEIVDPTTPCGKYWEHVFAQTSIQKDDNHFEKVTCEHFLDRVNDYIIANGLVCISLNQYLISIWTELGRIIFTWGCASRPTRA